MQKLSRQSSFYARVAHNPSQTPSTTPISILLICLNRDGEAFEDRCRNRHWKSWSLRQRTCASPENNRYRHQTSSVISDHRLSVVVLHQHVLFAATKK
ncbi:hypothetical protein HanRHA438_Chr09g0400051 [Helianthus annuus]|nr:hypothetical protein HanRHA438_Chr09g0400051 [Helianthus annuus]